MSHCSFQHKPTKVLANCTLQNTPGRVSDSREGTTFITNACANGTYMPPMIVVKGKTPKSLMGYNTLDGPKDAFWTHQQKAWTDNLLGGEWLQLFQNYLGQQQNLTQMERKSVRTRGGGHGGRGRGGRGSQSQSRLLTSDEIYQLCKNRRR